MAHPDLLRTLMRLAYYRQNQSKAKLVLKLRESLQFKGCCTIVKTAEPAAPQWAGTMGLHSLSWTRPPTRLSFKNRAGWGWR